MLDERSDITPGVSLTQSKSVKKAKKNQLPFGIGLFILIFLIGIHLSDVSSKLGLYWLIGNCLGFILEKSRFCFSAAIRDPYLTGSTSLTRALLIAVAITSIGFTAIKYGAFISGQPIPGQSYIVPVSFTTAAGAFLFGIGMVISGGCASGTLMRVGEGCQMQIISLLFFIIGSLWGAHDWDWWNRNFIMKGKSIFMPDIFGWFGAIFIQLLIIALLYIAADKWEKIKLGGND
ncbi:MAG TPA: transporter [Ruminiclostridium sp.]|mgnify:FL=1|nr:transporter [Ruminiclostridium sp.]